MGPILIVDDNYDFRLMLRELLQSAGYNVISVDTAHEALLALTRHPISLVITDISMPIISGFGLMRHMRSLDRPRPPVIAVTGVAFLASDEAKAAAASLGARFVLTKPVDREDLLKVVADAITAEPRSAEGQAPERGQEANGG
jgi:CheY-like chemotaxis protein